MNNGNSFKQISFSHAFQPIVDVELSQIVSYEILLRGSNGEPPNVVFNQVLPEELLLFDDLNRKKALCLAAKLGVTSALNINFSLETIEYKNGFFIQKTIADAIQAGISSSQLVLEITEDEAIHNPKQIKRILNHFREQKLKIAIDDFGAGYAGLNMLADIHPDMIKLDRMLITNIHINGARQAIVRGIYQICTALGIDLLAEGVECMEEFYFLRAVGITLYQGFLFAKPGFETLPPMAIPDKLT